MTEMLNFFMGVFAVILLVVIAFNTGNSAKNLRGIYRILKTWEDGRRKE